MGLMSRASAIIKAKFNKAVKRAVLVPIERGEGVRERDLPPLAPYFVAEDRTQAEWGFPTTPRMIGYRIELEDDRGFTNPVPIRRNVRMFEDRPPVVVFRPESNRNPDPKGPNGAAAEDDDKPKVDIVYCYPAPADSADNAQERQVWTNFGIVDSTETFLGYLPTPRLFRPTNPYEVSFAIRTTVLWVRSRVEPPAP